DLPRGGERRMSALRLGLCRGRVGRESGSEPSHSRPTRPRHRALFAALLLAFCATTSAAQEEALQGQAERQKALLEGTHVVPRLPHENIKDCTALDDSKQLNDDPKRTVLIVFGDLDRLARLDEVFPGGLKAFVRKGGAVLLASDRAPSEG